MKFLQKLGLDKMHLRKFKKSNEGVVGIVVAVLLVGLLVTFMSIIQVYYVPKWMKEKESEHMDEVSNQFSQLKFAIDTQTALNKEDIPMTSPVTLGSSELPFFMSMPAYGQLDIIDEGCKITLDNGTKTNYNLGIIRFTSINAYLVNQNFIYESGAIITSQDDQEGANIFSVKPFLKINSSDNTNLTFKLINISSIGGKTTSQTSTDATAIQTECNSFALEQQINKLKYINITTSYANSWLLFLESLLEKKGLANVDIINNQVVVDFNELSTVKLEEYEISAQIGPGWIEQ